MVKRVSGGILLSIVVLWLWYMVAAEYDYRTVSGTYILELDQGKSTLVQSQDKTFEQEIDHWGKVERSQGTWYRFGEGCIVFSSGFLTVAAGIRRPSIPQENPALTRPSQSGGLR